MNCFEKLKNNWSGILKTNALFFKNFNEQKICSIAAIIIYGQNGKMVKFICSLVLK